MGLHSGVVAMQATATCSVVFSLVVMISIVYKKLYNKLFLKLIFLISLCDCLNSLALVFGGARSESAPCYLQGIVTNYFSLASFFWSAVIAYEVQLIVFYQTTIQDLRLAAAFCWLVPLVTTLVPLSSAVMANDDISPGWCFLSDHHNPLWEDALWNLFGFYFWLIAVMIYLWYVVIVVCHKFFVQQRGVVPGATRVVLRILSYPLIVVVCWTANIVIELGSKLELKADFDRDSLPSIFFCYVLPMAQGALTAIAFFVTRELTANSGQRDDSQSLHERSAFARECDSITTMDSVTRSQHSANAVLEEGLGSGEEEDAVFGADSDFPPPPQTISTPPSAFGVFLSKIRRNNKGEPELEEPDGTVSAFPSSSYRPSEGSGNIEMQYSSSYASNFVNPIYSDGGSRISSLARSMQSDAFDLSRESEMAASWAEIDRSYYQ